ncbi:MAG: glycolate oxidase subunit GlcF [Granulosicoccaceae bacterium]
MQTKLEPSLRETQAGQHAESILRKCVHCGFCLATCPTYNLLGDELDSPRGRIYQIKSVLEGEPATESVQLHLDRCLTCRSCETTCPSGVQYHHLVDMGRGVVERQLPRSAPQRLLRWTLRHVVSNARLMTPAMRLGQLLRPAMPAALKSHVPARRAPGQWPEPQHARKMLVLAGCVQPGAQPRTNAATARVLDALGISLITAPNAGCCGAVRYHLNDHDGGLADMRRNIDAWWPLIEDGVEAIVMTASGCGAQVSDYAHLLAEDVNYAERAARVSELCKDIAEIIATEDLSALKIDNKKYGKIAYHPPCTLQHGQQLPEIVEGILQGLGFELSPVADKHLCCGSAGTYSILQKGLSQQLLENKIDALEADKPDTIASANIGCLMHIETGTATRVLHWIELLDR